MLWKNYATARHARTYRVPMFFIKQCFDFPPSTGFYARSGSPTYHFVYLTIGIDAGSGVPILYNIINCESFVRGFYEYCDEGYIVQVKDIRRM